MPLNMKKAFNSRMLYKMIRYNTEEGYYNEDNDYIRGINTEDTFFGVITTGNKFSQFDEGISRKPTTGGERFSDYKTLYVQLKWPILKMGDKIGFKGNYYNVLQKSDESIFGFNSYMIESPKDWTPNLED